VKLRGWLIGSTAHEHRTCGLGSAHRWTCTARGRGHAQRQVIWLAWLVSEEVTTSPVGGGNTCCWCCCCGVTPAKLPGIGDSLAPRRGMRERLGKSSAWSVVETSLQWHKPEIIICATERRLSHVPEQERGETTHYLAYRMSHLWEAAASRVASSSCCVALS